MFDVRKHCRFDEIALLQPLRVDWRGECEPRTTHGKAKDALAPGALAPLRRSTFLWVWLAMLVSNLGECRKRHPSGDHPALISNFLERGLVLRIAISVNFEAVWSKTLVRKSNVYAARRGIHQTSNSFCGVKGSYRTALPHKLPHTLRALSWFLVGRRNTTTQMFCWVIFCQ